MARMRSIPNPENCTLTELDAAIKATVTPRSRLRLQGIKALLIGIDYLQVVKLFEITERSLRTWVAAFNRQGIDGLIDRARPGRPRAIGAEHEDRLRDLIVRPSQAEITHWTAKK